MRILGLTLASGAIFASTANAAAPIACFTQSPANPVVGQAVTFDSTCSHDQDAGGRIAGRAWDLDNDGSYDDGTGVTATKTFSARGTYTVRLGVVDGANNVDTETKTVTVNQPPSASFTNTPAAPTSGQLVTFNSTSTDVDGTIASQAWDIDNDGAFDDGTATSATHTFTTPGDKTVKLRVTDNKGAQDTETRTITVGNRAPTVALASDPSSPQSGQSFTLTATAGDSDGSVASYAWDIDGNGTDNFTAGTATKNGSFAAPGSYPVKVRVTDNSGASTVATLTLVVGNRAPTVSLASNPASPTTGQAFTLTATAGDPDGSVASYAWDVDGNGTDNFTAGTATKTGSFDTPGTYPVKVRVTDNSGAATTTSLDLVVGNRAPTVSIASNPTAPSSGQSFTLTATAADPDGSVASYAWDVDGNGTDDFTAGTATKTGSFATPGNYPVKVRVTDNSGTSTVASLNLVVTNRAPTVSLASNPASPSSGETFTLTATAADPDGSIASYAWDVDGNATDNFTAGTATKTGSFAAPGNYPVKVRVTDNSGASTVATLNLSVGNKAPVASFTRSLANPQAPVDITFTSTSTDPDGTIAAYAWDTDADGNFDDGTGPSATRKFTNPGNKYVALRVTDNNGAVTIAEMRWTIANRVPTAQFTISNTSPVAGDEVTLTSAASDLDGKVASEKWDLDQDGQYDDATGSTAQVAPATAGTYSYGLSVVDDFGGTANVTKTVTFSAKPGEPPTDPNPPTDPQLPEPRSDESTQTFDTSTPITPIPPATPIVPDQPTPVAPLRFLNPFPVVRLRGRTTKKGAELSLFTVRAPHGSLVQVTCKGSGCPAKRLRETIKTRSKRGSATVHFKRLERFLRAGTQLEVAVTQKGKVGKYTRILIRKMAVPVRSDRCLLPDSTKPAACPKTP